MKAKKQGFYFFLQTLKAKKQGFYFFANFERYDIRVHLLQNLSCRDVVEISVPPAFMICFLLVNKSSNREVFSSVGSQEMGFEQITPSSFYHLMIYWAFDNGMLFMLSQLCNCKIRISMRKHIIMPMFQKYGKGNIFSIYSSLENHDISNIGKAMISF